MAPKKTPETVESTPQQESYSLLDVLLCQTLREDEAQHPERYPQFDALRQPSAPDQRPPRRLVLRPGYD